MMKCRWCENDKNLHKVAQVEMVYCHECGGFTRICKQTTLSESSLGMLEVIVEGSQTSSDLQNKKFEFDIGDRDGQHCKTRARI